MSALIKKHYRSPFPERNVHWNDEPISPDNICSFKPDIDDGSICAQLFVGIKSLVSYVHVMKTKNQFVKILEYNIYEWGAMSKLINDHAQSEVRNRAQSILWDLFIDDLEKWTTLSAPEKFWIFLSDN